MKFVILHTGVIPGYGNARGPVMTPQEYDLKDVLKWVSHGIDIREVMEDGSYRKLEFNDRRINEAINNGLNKVNNDEPRLVNINDILKKESEEILEEDDEEEEVLIEPFYLEEPKEMTEEEREKILKAFEEIESEEAEDEGFEIDELEESE